MLRNRLAAAGGAAAAIVIGLAVRKGAGGAIGEHGGNVAWGVMWVMMVWCAAPDVRVRVIGLAAVAIVFVIEFFQLTPWPARWSEASNLLRYLVGGRFEVHDLVGGAVGVAVGCIALRAIRGASGRALAYRWE